jgi:hypothetical protein
MPPVEQLTSDEKTTLLVGSSKVRHPKAERIAMTQWQAPAVGIDRTIKRRTSPPEQAPKFGPLSLEASASPLL